MKLAAIDIGSNAVRLQISRILKVDGETNFKRVEYLRFPLKLGQDVFTKQYVSAESEQKLLRLLHAFKLLIELYGVTDCMICATSALREAHNQREVVQNIKELLGLSVEIIDGEQEASLIDKAIRPLLADCNYLHVDVGGGSTEVSFYLGQEKIAARSFKIGAIKLLEHCDTTSDWEVMQTWICAQKQRFKTSPIGIATGGNIRKLAQLARRGLRKKSLSLERLNDIKEHLAMHSVEERINKLALNPDRAHVILPAAKIYTAAMKWGGVDRILVPDVSLRDGIIQFLYEKISRK